MASTWTLLVALALFAGAQSADASSRIVGGNATRVEDYPSIVQVEFKNIFSQIWSQSCAGTILTRRYILSAAQCFSGSNYSPELRRIRAGSSTRNVGGVISYIQDAFNHESFGSLGSEGDISVVRLITPLIYTPVVQQGGIIRQGTVIPADLPVTYAGWGLTTAGGNASSDLLTTSVFTVNNTVCAERYASLPEEVPVTKNMICAGLLDIGGRDACVGDSGGPLYYNNVVIGVISSGIGCGNATYPAISTSVASYTDWILSIAV